MTKLCSSFSFSLFEYGIFSFQVFCESVARTHLDGSSQNLSFVGVPFMRSLKSKGSVKISHLVLLSTQPGPIRSVLPSMSRYTFWLLGSNVPGCIRLSQRV